MPRRALRRWRDRGERARALQSLPGAQISAVSRPFKEVRGPKSDETRSIYIYICKHIITYIYIMYINT